MQFLSTRNMSTKCDMGSSSHAQCDPMPSRRMDRCKIPRKKSRGPDMQVILTQIMAVVVVLLVIATIVSCVFLGIFAKKVNRIHDNVKEHRFCIEARGFFEFGEDTNDPDGLALGHLTVDQEHLSIRWYLKFQLTEGCGLSAWHIHGPIGTSSPNAGVFKQLPSLPFGPAVENSQNGLLEGSISITKAELKIFLEDPELFYLNFHSQGDSCHPAGAMRSAINKICPNTGLVLDNSSTKKHHIFWSFNLILSVLSLIFLL